MIKNALFLIFLASFMGLFAQEKAIISGRIVSQSTALEGIFVKNISTTKVALTSASGVFYIEAKAADTLAFSAVHLKDFEYVLTENDLKNTYILIPMDAKNYTLNEVVIKKETITTENLGIIPRGMKSYTPAERKLKTANSTTLDALLNLLSGRTKMLKKELIVERKLLTLDLLNSSYTTEFYTEKLKIPTEYVNGFKYYCIEFEEIAEVLKQNKPELLDLLMLKYSEEYIKLIPTVK